jgi:hypothetical protein
LAGADVVTAHVFARLVRGVRIFGDDVVTGRHVNRPLVLGEVVVFGRLVFGAVVVLGAVVVFGAQVVFGADVLARKLKPPNFFFGAHVVATPFWVAPFWMALFWVALFWSAPSPASAAMTNPNMATITAATTQMHFMVETS